MPQAEAGCLRYEVSEDRDHPGRYIFIEKWTSEAALESHVGSAHFQAMTAQLAPICVQDFEITFLSPLNIDGTRAAPIENTRIIVIDGGIVAAGAAAAIDKPGNQD